jgi:CheY-like chemotaxis protein/glycine cleavage system H lipoate-binding protein
MKPARDLLVIDDEPVITRAVERVCRAEGLSVDLAGSAAEALARLEQGGYRLIVCDVMMSDVDGFGFLEALGRKGIRTPVIMSTGMSTMENAVRALASGAIDFVPKPFSADELLAAVHRGLKYAKIQDAATLVTAPGLPTSLPYVPCPPRYYRLGYASWVSVEGGGTALVGVSDLFLKTIEGVTAIALAAADEEVVQGSPCATLTSPDGLSHTVLSPVSGRIVETNALLPANPTVVERDPYFQGWLYRVLPADLEYALQHLTSCSSDRV